MKGSQLAVRARKQKPNLHLSYRLITVRKAAQLTQLQMADVIGVRQGTYCLYEQGKRQMSLAGFTALVDILAVDPNWLLFGDTDGESVHAKSGTD